MLAIARFHINPSHRYLLLLSVIYLLAILALAFSSLSWLIQAAVIIYLIVYGYYHHRPQPTKLIYQGNNLWHIQSGTKNWQMASLSPKTLCFGSYVLLVLQIKDSTRLFYLPILAGDMDRDAFRRLRVLLRFYN